jgi:hypothetical protein
MPSCEGNCSAREPFLSGKFTHDASFCLTPPVLWNCAYPDAVRCCDGTRRLGIVDLL